MFPFRVTLLMVMFLTGMEGDIGREQYGPWFWTVSIMRCLLDIYDVPHFSV